MATSCAQAYVTGKPSPAAEPAAAAKPATAAAAKPAPLPKGKTVKAGSLAGLSWGCFDPVGFGFCDGAAPAPQAAKAAPKADDDEDNCALFGDDDEEEETK